MLDFIDTYKPLLEIQIPSSNHFSYHKLANYYRDHDSLVFRRGSQNFYRSLNAYAAVPNLPRGDRRRFKKALALPRFMRPNQQPPKPGEEGWELMWVELDILLRAFTFIFAPNTVPDVKKRAQMQARHDRFCAELRA